MAWPVPSCPPDSCGEVESVLELPLVPLSLDVPELVLELVVLVVLDSAAVVCACAAAAATSVPARPAATSPAVIAVVRRSPVSRSIDSPPPSTPAVRGGVWSSVDVRSVAGVCPKDCAVTFSAGCVAAEAFL